MRVDTLDSLVRGFRSRLLLP